VSKVDEQPPQLGGKSQFQLNSIGIVWLAKRPLIQFKAWKMFSIDALNR
jgi:hypothetical protein